MVCLLLSSHCQLATPDIAKHQTKPAAVSTKCLFVAYLKPQTPRVCPQAHGLIPRAATAALGSASARTCSRLHSQVTARTQIRTMGRRAVPSASSAVSPQPPQPQPQTAPARVNGCFCMAPSAALAWIPQQSSSPLPRWGTATSHIRITAYRAVP